MTSTSQTRVRDVLRRNPLQAGKFVGILLSLVLGVAGFFRIIDAKGLVDNPLLGDGQFLSLILLPLVSIGLVCLVFVETVVTGYRVVRSDESLKTQAADRIGYLMIRSAEAAVALFGVAIIATALPVLTASSTPAPVGIGIMLLFMVVGLAILVTSLVRSIAELFVYSSS